MKPKVAKAIGELEIAFPDSVIAHKDSEGGSLVIIGSVKLGKMYSQEDTWLGFHIKYAYPYTDLYPMFVREDLKRVDGRGFQPINGVYPFNGLSEGGTFPSEAIPGIEPRPAVQISRRINLSDGPSEAVMDAVVKVKRVIEWLNAL